MCVLNYHHRAPEHLYIDGFGAKFTIVPILRGRFDVNINTSWDLI